jgi:hypothetical protein
VHPASVLYSIKDPSVFEPLARIATVSEVDYKRRAIQGLRNLGDRRAMPIFVAALDDPDPLTQKMAIMSLARFTGKFDDYAPAGNLFDQRPGYYVALWKDWWQEHQQEYTSPK